MVRKRMVLALALSVALVALFSCKKGQVAQSKGTLSEIRQRGYITIATSPDYPPFEYLDDNDDLVGIEIELIAKVAEDMKLKLRYHTVDYSEVAPGVISEKYDLGVSGFSITEDGSGAVLFSTPHSIGGLRMVVPSTSKIKGREGLNGAVVAALSDSTSSDYCQAKGYRMLLCNTNSDALEALYSGKADVWVADSIAASLMMSVYNESAQDKLVMLDEQLTRDEYAFIAAKDNEDFIIEVNKSLRRLRDDGTIARIFLKYDTVYNQAKDYILL